MKKSSFTLQIFDKSNNLSYLLIICFFLFPTLANTQTILPGAYHTSEYIKLLKNKNIAIVANQTSVIGTRNLVDSLLSLGVKVRKIFTPEHGFRGLIGAGETVIHETDIATGLPIISLYGKTYKPKATDLMDVDIIVFDIQDVGVRFYTYLSTLHYVMEACAENHKQLIVLDRPNPNGFYIAGPVLNLKYRSFVGLHPVPIVYGMTIGEYAQMINGEKWLKNEVQCMLTIIKCDNYNHKSKYILPIAPSPNLPDMKSIYLYPSLALFEGTIVNVGRGTTFPFKVFGHPCMVKGNITYTPKSMPHVKEPMHQNKACNGLNLLNDSTLFTIKYIQFAYNNIHCEKSFFNNFFLNLSGTDRLKTQIIENISEEEIKKTWQEDIDRFKLIREKYLLYKDF
jgi:uncharacterized protein YbbC (DUF1343 family)